MNSVAAGYHPLTHVYPLIAIPATGCGGMTPCAAEYSLCAAKYDPCAAKYDLGGTCLSMGTGSALQWRHCVYNYIKSHTMVHNDSDISCDI